MGALLDFKTYIQALRLSLTSYGFTQEQVGIQMDTLARRVEGLKQAFMNFTTSSGGGFNTLLKEAITIITKLLQTLNSFDTSTLAIFTVMNLIAFKGPEVVKAFRSMAASVMTFGRSMRSAGKMATMSNILLTLLTVAADFVVLTGAFKTATGKAAEEVDNLNKKLETESELYSRQSEAIPIVEQLGEAYRTINEQLEQTQEGTSEVSVPLRGLWFLSFYPIFAVANITACFRPLAGIMVLIMCCRCMTCKGGENSFRPLAGIMVLIKGSRGIFKKVQKCFRPLAGIMVLIRKVHLMLANEILKVSVPLRGLWFLSIKNNGDIVGVISTVSVPLRGLWFLSLITEYEWQATSGFRPLAGIMVLIGQLNN